MSASDLLAYVSPAGLSPNPGEEAFAGACWAESSLLVAQHVGGTVSEGVVTSETVPAEILTRACLEVGAELYHRRAAKNGITQFASPDTGAGIRIARDPMVAAYPILAPYVGRGIA